MLILTDTQLVSSSVDRSFHGFRRTQVIDDSLVLITESPHVAAIYHIESNKSICSWYFTETERLTCPVVYDYISKKCIAVQKNRYLSLMSIPKSREPAEDANNNMHHENGVDAGETMEHDGDDDVAQDTVEKNTRYKFNQSIVSVIANKDGESLVLLPGGCLKFLSAAIESRSESSTVTYIPPDEIVTVELLAKQKSNKLTSVPQSHEVILVSQAPRRRLYHRLMIDVASHQIELKETFDLPPLIVLNVHPITGCIFGIDENSDIVKINHGLVKKVHHLQPLNSKNHLNDGGAKSGVKGDQENHLQPLKVRCITSFPCSEDLVALFIDITDSEFTIMTLDLRFGFTQETAISLPPVDSSSVQIADDLMYILSTSGLSVHTFSIGPLTLASITRERSANLVEQSNSSADYVNSNDTCELIRLLNSLPSMKIGEMLDALKQLKKKSGILIPESITAVLVNELICRQPNLKQRETEQLIEVILRTPFNTTRLAVELKAKSIEACKVLKTISILLDRASEEDVLTPQVLDLISILIDCNLSQILIRVDSLSELLSELKKKLDRISDFYTVATSLKSHLDAILSKNFKFEPSITLRASQPIPPYSVVVIHI